jgi:muconolactone D-isomerase
MLFFIRAELKSSPPLTREQWLGRVAATWEVIKQLEQNGKVVAGGAFIGQRAGCVIVDVDSNEELSDMLNRLPLFAHLEWEVTPLISAERALESAKWALQQLALAGSRSN